MVINYVATSHKLDWVPVVSTLKNLCDLYSKYAYKASVDNLRDVYSDDESDLDYIPLGRDALTYSNYLVGKSNVRCTLGLLPVVGNVVLFYSDTCTSSIWEIIPVISTVKDIADFIFWNCVPGDPDDYIPDYDSFLRDKFNIKEFKDYLNFVPLLGNGIKLYRNVQEYRFQLAERRDEAFISQIANQLKNCQDPDQYKQLSTSLAEYPYESGGVTWQAWDTAVKFFPEDLAGDRAYILTLIEQFVSRTYVGKITLLTTRSCWSNENRGLISIESPVSKDLLTDPEFMGEVLKIIHNHLEKWNEQELRFYDRIRGTLIELLDEKDRKSKQIPGIPERIIEFQNSKEYEYDEN